MACFTDSSDIAFSDFGSENQSSPLPEKAAACLTAGLGVHWHGVGNTR
jgi:hypothetical protein